MKAITLFTAAALIACSCSQQNGWTPLFNGENLDGWEAIAGGAVPEGHWIIKDGILSTNPDIEGKGSDIVTLKTYGNFRLRAEFRMDDCSNSGIKYLVNPGTWSQRHMGLEYQIIDDAKFADKVCPITNLQTTGSLYDLVSARKGSDAFDCSVWNKAEIVVSGAHCEHWLNGTKVMEVDRDNSNFDLLLRNSKFKDEKGFGKTGSGHILLQYHGGSVHFRNIEIMEMD